MLERLIIIGLIVVSVTSTSFTSSNIPTIDMEPYKEFTNATLFVITNAYFSLEKYDGKIVMHRFRYPHLPGIFIIVDENGIEALNIAGGWRAYIEIYGFNGFLKEGAYIILIGSCDKITITPVR